MARTHWLAAFALVAACGPRLPEETVEGRFVRYHYWSGEPAPCSEAVSEIDDFVQWLGDRLGRALPSDFHLDYYKLRSVKELQPIPQCSGAHVDGCAVGTAVYAPTLTHDHEVVHAVMSRLGFPPQLFVEGLAVVFGCGASRYAGDPLATVDLKPYLDNDKWSADRSSSSYQAAAAFTKSLIDRHGLEALVRFYESTPHGAAGSDLEQRFASAFGENVDAALAAWNAAGPFYDGEFCIARDDRCDSSPDLAIAAAGPTSNSSEVTCLDPVIGLEAGTSAAARVRFTAEQEGRALTLRRCSRDGSPSRQLTYAYANVGLTTALAGRWIDLWTQLVPGRYALTISRTHLPLTQLDSEAPIGGTATVDVAAVPAIAAQDCSAALVPVPDDTWLLSFAASQTSASGGLVRLSPSVQRKIEGAFFRGLVAQPAVCTACGPPPGGCAPLSSEPGRVMSASSVVTLEQGADGGSYNLDFVLAAP